MKNRTAFILSCGAFLLGTLGAASAYWIEGPTNPFHGDYQSAANYDAPVCPPGFEPLFFGVTIVEGVSRPIYQCLRPDLGGSDAKVAWDDAATLQTVPN